MLQDMQRVLAEEMISWFDYFDELFWSLLDRFLPGCANLIWIMFLNEDETFGELGNDTAS
jgi:hypothetical protein